MYPKELGVKGPGIELGPPWHSAPALIRRSLVIRLQAPPPLTWSFLPFSDYHRISVCLYQFTWGNYFSPLDFFKYHEMGVAEIKKKKKSHTKQRKSSLESSRENWQTPVGEALQQDHYLMEERHGLERRKDGNNFRVSEKRCVIG